MREMELASVCIVASSMQYLPAVVWLRDQVAHPSTPISWCDGGPRGNEGVVIYCTNIT
jgi:hypothetical protein